MDFTSSLNQINSLPGITPKEKIEILAKAINCDSSIGMMQKAQMNIAISFIQQELKDPVESERKALGIAKFISNVFDYEVEFTKREGNSE